MVKGIKRFIVVVLAAFLVFSQVYTAFFDMLNYIILYISKLFTI